MFRKSIEKMKSISKKIVSNLGGKGLFGIEFFITKDDDVYFSELSPGLMTLVW